jgi:acyl-coenzyme A thioesterase PaaI-like protein
MNIPDGFRPMAELRTSPFLERVGPFYFRREGRDLVLGLRLSDGHANARGTAHGGLLLTMADVALGYQLALTQEPPVRATTASVSADFLGAANVGDWLQAQVEMQQLGARLAFANAYLTAGERRVARVSATFLRAGELPNVGA